MAEPGKKDTRMDAAIEHMTRHYKFRDEQLVRKVVNDLLEEYKGNWYIIERHYYDILLRWLMYYYYGPKHEGKKTEISNHLSSKDTRMDAAIEHMKGHYKFKDEKLVRKVVNNLLKENGGNWYDIERFYYDKLLRWLMHYYDREHEGKKAEKSNHPSGVSRRSDSPVRGLFENDYNEGAKKDHGSVNVADPSFRLPEAPISQVNNSGLQSSRQDDKKSSSHTFWEAFSWRGGADSSGDKDYNNRSKSNKEAAQSSVAVPATPDGNLPVPLPPGISAPPRLSWPPKNRPCAIRSVPSPPRISGPYGYIDSDEVDIVDDFYEFEPAMGFQDLKPAKRGSS